MFSADEKQILLDIAARSIRHGLDRGHALKVNLHDYPAPLREQRASFVTLHINEELRGCIGMLQAIRPLVEDVAENAYAAAFRDPRFPALREDEYGQLHYHISVLNPAEPIQFSDEQDLLRQLRPGVDGLILEDGKFRGTFLPSVWESLAEPVSFLQHLKQKAGLSANYWSDSLQVQRYTVEDIE